MVPELPEVETIRLQLDPSVVSRTIDDVEAFDNIRFSEAHDSLGYRIDELNRRGKYLIFELTPGEPRRAVSTRTESAHTETRSQETGSDEAGSSQLRSSGPRQLIVHLGMTGRLSMSDEIEEHPHLRAAWRFDDGSVLLFHDMRRFGLVAVVPKGDHARLPTLHGLGPEPFSDEFIPASLTGAMTGRRPIKSVLLGQRAVAGVGNIYADEALWLAGIRPAARRLGPERAQVLHAAVIEVLQNGIDDGGTTLRDYRNIRGEGGTHQHQLHCYGMAGHDCLRCGETLRGTRIDGRGTTYCPGCQT